MATLHDFQRKLTEFGKEIQNLSGKVFSILPDHNGMIDRQCPQCKTFFKINDASFEQIEERSYCPSCGESSGKSEFITDDHREQITKGINQALLDNWNSNATIPNNVFNIDSTAVELNQFTCKDCQAIFAVEHVAKFCPSCGMLHLK